MQSNRFDGLGRAVKELEVACIATLRAWSRHLWTEIRESVVDDDDREAARKFSSGYALVRSIVISGVMIIFSGICIFAALGFGVAIWRNIPLHQVEWLHTDSPLVRPLVVGAYALILILWVGPNLQLSSLRKLTDQERFALKNEARKTLAQICGGAILLTGLYASFRTLDVSREGQLNELYSKSVEQIGATETGGKPKVEVRVGGIYSLGRIANDSQSLRFTVYNVLASYIRAHVPFKGDFTKPQAVAPDVQAAINVLQGQPVPNWPLWQLDLRGYNLKNGIFQGADLTDADLRGDDLNGADLRTAMMYSADLRDAHLDGAHVEGTDLRRTILTQVQVDNLVGDAATQLPTGITRPSKWLVQSTN